MLSDFQRLLSVERELLYIPPLLPACSHKSFYLSVHIAVRSAANYKVGKSSMLENKQEMDSVL